MRKKLFGFCIVATTAIVAAASLNFALNEASCSIRSIASVRYDTCTFRRFINLNFKLKPSLHLSFFLSFAKSRLYTTHHYVVADGEINGLPRPIGCRRMA